MPFWLKRANLLFFLNQAYKYLCSRFSSGSSWGTCSLTGEGLEEERSTELYFSTRNDPPLLAILQPHLGHLGWGEPRYQETAYLNMVSEFISSEHTRSLYFYHVLLNLYLFSSIKTHES